MDIILVIQILFFHDKHLLLLETDLMVMFTHLYSYMLSSVTALNK